MIVLRPPPAVRCHPRRGCRAWNPAIRRPYSFARSTPALQAEKWQDLMQERDRDCAENDTHSFQLPAVSFQVLLGAGSWQL